MKKLIILPILLCLLSSCSSIRYLDYKDTTGYSIDNKVNPKSLKTGTACVTNVLLLVATGDSSIEAARRDGNITKIAFVDTSYNSIWLYLPFFERGCTIVRGE